MTKTRSLLHRGDDARRKLKEAQDKQEAKREAASNRGPSRFYVRKKERGSGYATHELIFLDEDVRNCPQAYEHSVPGPGNDWSKTQHHLCVDETDDCALCRAAEQGLGEEFTEPKYGMYATVIDTTPYTIKKGPRAGETIEHTRKLYVVAQQAIEQLHKVASACIKEHGTTRGMIVEVTKSQQTDPRSGVLQPLDNGKLYDIMSEGELEDEFFNERVVVNGRTIKEEGEDIEEYDYEEILAPMDQDNLRKLYRLPARPGSEQDTGSRREPGRRRRRSVEPAESGGAGTEEDDVAREAADSRRERRSRRRGDTDTEDAPEPASARRSRRADLGPDEVDDEDDDENAPATEDGGDEEEAPPRTTRDRASRRAAPAEEPAPRSRRRRAEPEEEEPAPRRRRREPTRAELDDEIPF